MRKNILFLAAFSAFMFVTGAISAQQLPSKGVGFLYNKEKVYDFRFHTNKGVGFGYQKGKILTYYKTTFYQIGVSELKHPKEFRQGSDPALTRSYRPYTYGKQNNFFAIRGAYGTKRYFSEKAQRKGVAVGMSYSFGGTLGILKPYYLALRRPYPDQPGLSRVVSERYSESNADLFLDDSRIIGASSFFKGFSQIQMRPGINAAIATHLDWGAFDEFLKALEVGLMIDFFPTKLPILVSEENQRLFLNFYCSAQLGKRK